MPSWRATVANTSAAIAEHLGAVALDAEPLHPLLDGRADDRRQRLLERGELEARRCRDGRRRQIFASASALPPVAARRRRAGARRAPIGVHQRRGVAPHHAGLGLGDRAVEPERLEQPHRADRQRVPAPRRARRRLTSRLPPPRSRIARGGAAAGPSAWTTALRTSRASSSPSMTSSSMPASW